MAGHRWRARAGPRARPDSRRVGVIAKRPQTPPADLASRSPDWFSWPTSAVLWQLAATTGRWSAPFATLRHFGPLPSARFDPHSPPPHTSPTEGVLYAGTDLLTLSLIHISEPTR